MTWMSNSHDDNVATAPLTLTTHVAGSTIVNIGPIGESTCYFLSTSPGTSSQNPTIALAGFVVVPLLLAVQIKVLAVLAVYASHIATWISSLNSFAMLRLGAELGREDMPTVSALEAEDAK